MSRTLQTPSINKIQAFDPAFEKQIKFTYTDSQSVKNRAVIINNATSEIVYDKTQTAMRSYHLLPANTLVPGNQYLVQIQVFDSDGNSSNLSDAVLMYCYSSPTFYITNVNNEIKNSSINPHISYFQNEGETIKNFQFMLYDNNKVMIDNSPVYYSLENDNYSFHSMVNASTYYVRAVGETTHGMSLDTGYIEFVTNFVVIPATTIFSLENNYNGGYISIVSNIKDVGYIEENCVIKDGVLTITNGFLEYNEGFEIEDNLYLRLLIKQIPMGKFLQTNDNTFTVSLIKVCEDYYIELRSGMYVLYNSVNVKSTSNDQYFLTDTGNSLYIEILRKNMIYEIRTSEEEV